MCGAYFENSVFDDYRRLLSSPSALRGQEKNVGGMHAMRECAKRGLLKHFPEIIYK